MSSKRLSTILSVVLWVALIWPGVLVADLDESEEESSSPSGKTTSPLIQRPEDLKQNPAQQTTQPSINKPQVEPRPAQKPRGKPAKAGVVKFWSKSLSGFREGGTLILEEDVVVTQDDIRIEADKATIFFEQGGKDVKEVHAVGSVKFSRTDPETGQPIRAEGKEAIFYNAKRNVVLKGDPILNRGDDVVRGKVIYYDLTNGWVKADRVEGIVQPAAKKAGSK